MNHSVEANLAEGFLAAALEPDLWLSALDGLAEATGSMRGQLIGIGGPTNVPFNWVTNLPDQALDDFIAIEGGSERVNFRVAAGRAAAPGTIAHEDHYAEACARLDTDVYLDFCNKYELPFGCQATILHREDMLVGLALLRSQRDGRTTDEERRLFASLVPHVRAAVHMQMAMENQGATLIAGAMEAMALPAFVLDGLGKVCATTAGAEAALGEGHCVRVVDRMIRGCSPADDNAIDAAIAAVVSRRTSTQDSAVIRVKGPGFERALLSVMRLPTRPMNFGFAPHALAVLRMPGRGRGASGEILKLAFNLTTAESEVAAALAAGKTRVEIAIDRRVSLETVRAQLKSLFHKTGVSREGELVAKLAQFGL